MNTVLPLPVMKGEVRKNTSFNPKSSRKITSGVHSFKLRKGKFQ